MKYSITLAALAATVSAGTATVKSLCGAPVYLYAVDAQRNPGQADKVLNYGDTYTEDYHTPSTGGVSLKLSRTPNLIDGTISQFEYTLTGGGFPFIWYDGSNVNCQGSACPFYANGVYMSTSLGSCPTRTCTPGQVCTGFYNLFNDDVNSLSCDPTSSITMVLCSTDGVTPSSAEKGLFPNLLGAVASIVGDVLNPAPAAATTPALKPVVANEVAVPTSSAAAATPTPSAGPVFQMEALHVAVAPAASSNKHRRALQNRHAHMRRHAHAHIS
jgi:hypothetical protein